ncbi:MAG: YciI family protein [Methyloceanibacter sp.]|uniref:YciI family protein n=1 Tax=Methyloceanibacter sp. TaxID=1965321 RepID=UPI003D6DA6FA
MLFALICTDKPDSLSVRKAHRPDHLAYLDSLGDALVFAGPFTEEDGQTMNGSLIVIEAPSLQVAREIAGRDPFTHAGLFASVDIRPWLWVIDNTEEDDEEE